MTKQVEVTRILKAPVEEVWKVLTDPDLVKQWWGPDRFTCPSARIDFHLCGTSLVCMRAPEDLGGGDTYSIWTYTRINPLETIEFIQNLADINGNKQDPVILGMPPDFPEDIKTVVSFKEPDRDMTEITFTEYADFGQMYEFAQMGLEQCLDKVAKIFN